MWRLGLDIGSNSIGWAILGLSDSEDGIQPSCIEKMGVRIFSDGREPAAIDKISGLPKIGESLAVSRRSARGMRRSRDRRVKRVRAFADKLVEFGLASSSGVTGRKDRFHKADLDVSINPYEARAKAALEIVDSKKLARALFHLCKRRGFLSNRKTDGEDKDASERKSAMSNLNTILKGSGCTLGQYLFSRIQNGNHIRFRGDEQAEENGQPIYPLRAMYIDEFNTIRQIQGNSLLSNEQWDELYAIFSFQRPLLPKEPGACSFEHGRDGRELHTRAWRHLPVSHSFRIVQEVNNLRYYTKDGEHDLTQDQREQLYDALDKQKGMAFSKIRTTLLKLPKSSSFNLESSRRKKLEGNATAEDMRKVFKEHDIKWDDIDVKSQNDIVQQIHDAANFEDFLKENKEQGWNLPENLVQQLSNKYYPSAHGHLSRHCMEKLLPLMEKGMQYWEAAQEVYGDHTDYSHVATGEIVTHLPYYGEVLRGATTPVRETENTPEEEKQFGKIPNPTVHVALNQLRKLVNSLVARYGNPHEIHLELARNVTKAGEGYKDLLKMLADNTKKNEKRRKLFEECFPGQKPSGIDLQKIRLWDELSSSDKDAGKTSIAHIDVYTGKTISFTQLFSDEIEIEHILPYSRTYDDSLANKTVTFRDVNRRKGGSLLPYSFAEKNTDIDADDMVSRAQDLPKAKRWRFGSDAMEIYEKRLMNTLTVEEKKQYDIDKTNSFIDRQLIDTQYISKIAARYLVPVVGSPTRVIPVKGQVTNLIRNKWQINGIKAKGTEKERQDHRHHAEDALIVALTDRSLVQQIADYTKKEQEKRQNFRAKLTFPPRPDWVMDKDIQKVADQIIVSHKQEHNLNTKLYEETAYGFIGEEEEWRKQGYNGVVRRNIKGSGNFLKEKEVNQIRDEAVRAAVEKFLAGPEAQEKKKWDDKLALLAQTPIQIGGGKDKTFLRRVRIVIKNQAITAIPSASYKGYTPDSIAFCDIWHTPKLNKQGKYTGNWKYEGVYIPYTEAQKYHGDEAALHQKFKPHPAAKKIMRLFKNDMVQLEDGENPATIMRVAGYSATQNKLDVKLHTDSVPKQNFKAIPVLMEKQNMKKIAITVDGRLSYVKS